MAASACCSSLTLSDPCLKQSEPSLRHWCSILSLLDAPLFPTAPRTMVIESCTMVLIRVYALTLAINRTSLRCPQAAAQQSAALGVRTLLLKGIFGADGAAYALRRIDPRQARIAARVRHHQCCRWDTLNIPCSLSLAFIGWLFSDLGGELWKIWDVIKRRSMILREANGR